MNITNEQLIKEYQKICQWGKNCSIKQLKIVCIKQTELQKEFIKRKMEIPKI